MMQVFNAIVRLAGQTHHEVAKRGLTVPEIYVLRRIHGNDAVVKLQHVGYAELEPIDERERLDYEYKDGLLNLHEDQKTSIEKMFGADFSPLPEELRDYEGELVEKTATLAEFQESEPYASADAEAKGASIRKKMADKKNAKKDAIKSVPPVSRTLKRTALDAVL